MAEAGRAANVDHSDKHWLRCRNCGRRVKAGTLHYSCTACGGDLVVAYETAFPSSPQGRGLWRFFDRLPLQDSTNIVSLGEGDTSSLELSNDLRKQLGVARVIAKCEHTNPTGSFKDRIASVAFSIVKERALVGCAGTSSGNGGAAAAAYAARSGSRVVILATSDIVEHKLDQIRAHGGRVYIVRGVNHEPSATKALAESIGSLAASSNFFPFLTGGSFSPEAMEGVKTIAFELAEQRPDASTVYVPVGGGGLLATLHKGYLEAAETLSHRTPRLIGVQPLGWPTLSAALGGSSLPKGVETTISGLQVGSLYDEVGAITAIRESGGHTVEVPDEEIWEAQRILARQEGLSIEPAGATALAGAMADARSGRLSTDDTVALLLTGAGYKDPDAVRRFASQKDIALIDASDVARVLQDEARSVDVI